MIKVWIFRLRNGYSIPIEKNTKDWAFAKAQKRAL